MAADRAASADRLRRLGRGESIANLCVAQGIDRAAFDRWWHAEVGRRVSAEATATPALPAGTEIRRDERGVPRIVAPDDRSLFLAYGIAQAQDRLFQMDLRRRLGLGTMAALIGPDGRVADRVARTVGLHLAAEAEVRRLDRETRSLLEAFAAGVNAIIELRTGCEPIEYGFLGMAPEPWTALDSAACAMSWRWQLTGRMHVIAAPEVLRRELEDDRLWSAVLDAFREADDVSIVPSESADATGTSGVPSVGAPEDTGSNNWVVSGARSRSGKPILAGDPHMPYENVSSFYEVGLHGGSFDTIGAGLIGVPALAYGRNRALAWGITNNICSLRDLYEETVWPDDPASVEFDGHWEPLSSRQEVIEVAGGEPEWLTVQMSRHGPIVSDILPGEAAGTGLVSLRWQGIEPCDWLGAQLRVMRSSSVASARMAIRGWIVPTFNLMLADAEGHIGYQATGELPIRRVAERGYRPGSDPRHGWHGRIPAGEMPHSDDPSRGWLASANNRPATDDFHYPLSGTWAEGYRAKRIGQAIEAAGTLDPEAMARIQADVTALRSKRVVAGLLATLAGLASDREVAALELLRDWDGQLVASSAASALYEVFLWRWIQAVTAERVSADRVDFITPLMIGLGVELLAEDRHGWFAAPGRRVRLVRASLSIALDELTKRCGPEMELWTWGSIHRLALPHPLGARGDLKSLIGKPSWEIGGDSSTLSNHGFVPPMHRARDAGLVPDWHSSGGAGYRMVADLGDPTAALYAVTMEGQSAEIGSAHRDDQGDAFIAGRLYRMPLDPGSPANA
jgi:penicillin amidase